MNRMGQYLGADPAADSSPAAANFSARDAHAALTAFSRRDTEHFGFAEDLAAALDKLDEVVKLSKADWAPHELSEKVQASLDAFVATKEAFLAAANAMSERHGDLLARFYEDAGAVIGNFQRSRPFEARYEYDLMVHRLRELAA